MLPNEVPIITTDRLRLSRLTRMDVPRIVALASDPRVSAFTLNLPYPYTERDAVYWLNLAEEGFRTGDRLILAIRALGDDSLLGGISLTLTTSHRRAEIGYWLGYPSWNRGYVTEAVTALVEYSFTALKLHRLTSSHLAGNPASGRVLQKAGLLYEGALKDHIYKAGNYHTLLLYGRVRTK